MPRRRHETSEKFELPIDTMSRAIVLRNVVEYSRRRSNAGSELKREGSSFMSATGQSKTEGGLRTRGLFKSSSSDKPLISVITVVFNGAQYLENTIRSVVGQVYANVEYIIIDGGSTDGSLEIIRNYSEQIDYWVSEPDRGIYDAMNKGLDAASGEWINFMNAGDAFHSKNSLVATAEEFSDAMVCYSDAIFYLEDDGCCYFRQVPCNVAKYQFVHQSCVYKKQLHSLYGQYMVARGVTASDYLFFKCIPPKYWHKTKSTIAKYHVGHNISTGRRHAEQVYGIDLLFGSRTLIRTLASSWIEGTKAFSREIRKRLLSREGYLTHVDKYSKIPREEFWKDIMDMDDIEP
jgi:glycosyltransferase involved in cell wall biosynthesis